MKLISAALGPRKALLLLVLSINVLVLAGCTGQVRVWAGPAIAGNTAYIVTPDGKLLSLNLEARSRGEPFPSAKEWQFPAEKDKKLGPAYAAPIVHNDTIYLGSYGNQNEGKLYAIQASTGGLQWQFPPQGAVGNIVGTPKVVDKTVYIGSSDYNVYALDASSGELKWRFKAGNKVWAGVVTDENGTVFVASLDHKGYALDQGTGERKWVFQTNGAIASAPLYAKGVLYFGSADGKPYAVDAATGQKQWDYDAESWIWGTPLLDRGTLYVASLKNEVYALEATSGQPKWPQPGRTGGSISAAPVLVAGVLAIASQDGKVYAFDPANGTPKWDYPYPTDPKAEIFASMVSDKDMLYVMPFNNRLI